MMKSKLSDICLIEKGKQIDTNLLDDSNPYKYINGGIKESGFYTDFNTDEPVVTVSEGGASCGYVGYVEEKFWCGCHCYKLSKCKVEPKYLYYALKSNQQKIMNLRTGATMPNIKKELFKQLEINVDLDRDNQLRVINELDNIQNLININVKKLESFDELIKSRFIELFMDCDRDKYPLKKWKEVVIIKHGKDYKKNLSDKGGYPVYGSGGFMGLYANNYLVNENSIIIGRKGTIDKPLFIKEKFWNVDTAFGIEVNKQILNPIFFYIRSTMYNLKAYSTSTTLPSMTKDSLCEIEIGIPPLDLQNGFADFVETIDKSKFVVQQQIKDLEELLDKKMDEYFGG